MIKLYNRNIKRCHSFLLNVLANIETYFSQHLTYFTVVVLAVPVNGVLTYSVKSNLQIGTSSCKFIKLKSGLILFLRKREKTKKHLKHLHVLVPTVLLLKYKRSVNLYVSFIKIVLMGTEFSFKAFPI